VQPSFAEVIGDNFPIFHQRLIATLHDSSASNKDFDSTNVVTLKLDNVAKLSENSLSPGLNQHD
jgi:hypothetical protein